MGEAIYGALATVEPAILDALADAVSPDDAFELVKERRHEVYDLGEMWHGVHWLLARRACAGEADPASWAVLGRQSLPRLDRGRGAPGLVRPHDVPAVAAALARLDPKTARLRFDAEAMDREGIHPASWRRCPIARPGELAGHLLPLAALYRRARKEGFGTVGYPY